MQRALRHLTSSLALFATLTLGAVPMVVQLKSGAEISGEVLDQRDERVVVDLGFTVLAIPMSEIARLAPREAPAAPATTDSAGLFRTGGAGREASVKENVARLGSSVVQIRTPTGLGSGFVIHPDGYIVTNEHVIAGEYELTVTVFGNNGSAMEKTQYNHVRILALDPRLDLALLKIEDAAGRTFSPVSVGESESLAGGESVFAIGSPLGLERTVSQGIVSLRNRPMGGQLYIQTTAQINPGNSGGPLFNLRGEVVGVNNMKAMMVGVEGVNFAIPADVLKNFLQNRDAFAFDPRSPNAGFRYLEPPRTLPASAAKP